MKINCFEKIIFQFSFTNPEVVPIGMPALASETPEERLSRKSKAEGEMIISPTTNCSILDFVKKIQYEFLLMGAFTQLRIDGKDPRGKRSYNMIRFIFFPKRPPLNDCSCNHLKDLQDIASVSLWRVRCFSNPSENGGHTLSINLEARCPLFLPNGEKVVRWERDAEQNKIGDAPVPISPSSFLDIGDSGDIILRSA